ncbi:dTMP kinase [secondary endosymbiont of Ctenarytaina eucalypti]|uniref:Thymidylate kinase n=1 Tax=secondary endosymbiont of Ctenarytaina eucalypti TaxID=1199245 RepID=J3VTA3_9ENTR|nr:dTMP kinase [secondary endosymbiont of Ctenarytaina eucalypti]AFP85191.1 thymidylate kinase [secondary endosymbiont of Ctenarytaina eucalypti]
MNSKFIVIEGLEGAGKSSAIGAVVDVLRQQGIRDVVLTREPGSTPVAEVLRTLIKDGAGNESVTNLAELLMLYAARVQLVEQVIKPALARGNWVVGDRHDLSTHAYQGAGRGINARFLQALREAVLGNFYPDLTLYLDILPEDGLARVRSRAQPDRIEVQPLAFFERARSGYQSRAAVDERIVTIDASPPLDVVTTVVRARLMEWLRAQTETP